MAVILAPDMALGPNGHTGLRMIEALRELRTGLKWCVPLTLACALLGAGSRVGETKPTWECLPRASLAVRYDETALPRTGRNRTALHTMCTTITPGVTLRQRSGPDRLDLKYDLRATMYDEMENRDALVHYAGLIWRKRLNPSVTTTVNERFTYSVDSGGEQDEAITRVSTYANSRLKLGVDARAGKEKDWRWLANLGHERRAYDDDRYSNWYTVNPTLGVEWRLSKSCRLTVRQETKYLTIEDRDSERTHRTLAGYACQLPWNLRFDARAGLLTLDDGSRTDPAGSLRLSRRWKKADLSLRWERDASVSTGNSRVVRRDYLVVQPRYRINPETQAFGRISLVEQESVDDDRTDTTTWRSGVTVRRKLTDDLSADLGYTYVDQEVNGKYGTPLSGNIVSIGLRATF